MANQFFVWLGSGRTRKHDLADKVRLLDKIAKAALPVPNGGILLDDFYWLCVQEQMIVVKNGRFTAPRPQQLFDLLYNDIHFPKLNNPVAVRAAFSATPQFNQQFTNPSQLSDALCTLWSAIRLESDQTRRDILVMEMVAKETWGTAVIQPDNDNDQITYNNEHALALPQLGAWRRPDSTMPPFVQRLQMLLRGLRRTLDKKIWQVEWIDDGHVCWIIQITQTNVRKPLCQH